MSALLERLFGPQRIMRGKDLHGERMPTRGEALGTLGRIAWPSILESVLIALISMMDTMMVGTVSHAAIAAVGLSSQPRFIFLGLFF